MSMSRCSERLEAYYIYFYIEIIVKYQYHYILCYEYRKNSEIFLSLH